MSVINLCRRLTACCDPLGGQHEDHKDHSDGASSAAALWSVIIPICCLAAHVQESAFGVAGCSLRPLGNSIYRRTNGPRPSSTYFEPTGKLVGRRVVLCIGTPSHFLTPRLIISLIWAGVVPRTSKPRRSSSASAALFSSSSAFLRGTTGSSAIALTCFV